MKIMLFISSNKCSGASKILVWLANRLSDKNNEVSFVTYANEEDYYSLSKNVERIRLVCHKKRSIFSYFSICQQINRLQREKKYDVCISFLPIPSMILRLSFFIKAPKLICAERSDPIMENSTVARFSRCFYRFFDGVVFQSEAARQLFSERIRKKSIVITNPITNRFINKEYATRKISISHASRLEIKQKRQDILIEAMRIVVDRFPNVIIDIYGDGPDKEKLQKIVEEKSMTNNVVFHGNIEDVTRKLIDSKLFVFSSDYEGVPNALLEALSCCCPIVTTNYSPGGAVELIADHKCGFVVEREDYESMAEKILLLLSDEKLGNEFADNCMQLENIYNDNKILNLWEGFIREII